MDANGKTVEQVVAKAPAPDRLRKWMEQFRGKDARRVPATGPSLSDGARAALLALTADPLFPGKAQVLRHLLPAHHPHGRAGKEPLTPQRLREWADAYQAAHGGRLPRVTSGAIAGTAENWTSVNAAMAKGLRGFPEKITLPQWLRREYHAPGAGTVPCPRGRRGIEKERLTPERVRAWADQFRAAHGGRLPSQNSGPIPGTAENWSRVAMAMANGQRGFPECISLPNWLRREYAGFGVLAVKAPLTPQHVRRWVDAYRAAQGGALPRKASGAIAGTAENWSNVNAAMAGGLRGFPEKITLRQWLLREYPDADTSLAKSSLPSLTPQHLRQWVDAYRVAHGGRFPTQTSGVIDDAGSTWSAINQAMRKGERDFPERITLTQWLQREYPDRPATRRGRRPG